MKKNILIAFCAALMFTACGQKNAPEQSAQPESQTEAKVEASTGNDYSHLNPTTDNETQTTQEDLSGKVIALTASEFLDKITDVDPAKGMRYKGHTPCMVDFYADWCRPCMQLKPVTEKLAAKYKGQLIIYKVNVDKAQDVCQALNISSIPTLLFLKPNVQPGMMVGAPTEAELDQTIRDFLEK